MSRTATAACSNGSWQSICSRRDVDGSLRRVAGRTAAGIIDQDFDVSAKRSPRLAVHGLGTFVRRQIPYCDPAALMSAAIFSARFAAAGP